MLRRAFYALAASMFVALVAIGQTQEDYLDVFVVKVKPEKRAEFDALSKKVADANRRNKGDGWVAMETVYGEGNTVSFISQRRNYAEIEKASEAFMGALSKAYGQAGATKVFNDFNNCIISSRSEVRRRRWDLSANAPADPAAMAKLVGGARWVRTTIVHVRPGQGSNFELFLQDVKAGAEKANRPYATLVSQSDSGQQGSVFYISRLVSSLADLDNNVTLRQLLGEEGFQKAMRVAAEAETSVESVISRFLPELSNPPEAIASAAPAFWRPKPASAAKSKPKAPAGSQ